MNENRFRLSMTDHAYDSASNDYADFYAAQTTIDPLSDCGSGSYVHYYAHLSLSSC